MTSQDTFIELRGGRARSPSAGLVAGAQDPFLGEGADEAPDRGLVVEDPLDGGRLLAGVQDAGDEDVFRRVEGDVDKVVSVLHAGHGSAPSTLYVV